MPRTEGIRAVGWEAPVPKKPNTPTTVSRTPNRMLMSDMDFMGKRVPSRVAGVEGRSGVCTRRIRLHEFFTSRFNSIAMLHVVLIEPEIPQNTGNIARLCVAAGARLHLVGPLGFSIDEKAVKRSGMDYWDRLDLRTWESFEVFRAAHPEARFWYLSSKVERNYWDVSFSDGDFLVFGRETKGRPSSLLAAHPESSLTIPMTEGTRSINLATSAGIVLYEALRQLNISGLQMPLAGKATN